MAIHQQTAAANIRNHSRCIIAGALAATAMLELEGERNAWAQAAQCQPTTIKPFEGDASALKGYSGEVRLMIDACERGRVVVRSEQNPNGQSIVPQFAPGPSGYRSGLTLNTCRVGEEDRPGARLDLAYRVGPESRPAGGASFTLAPDEEPPRITEVTPLSGTKVRPGQRMTIKVTASEAYADGNQGWQGGVKSIRVQDLTSHSDLPPWTNDNPRQQPCGTKTGPRLTRWRSGFRIRRRDSWCVCASLSGTMQIMSPPRISNIQPRVTGTGRSGWSPSRLDTTYSGPGPTLFSIMTAGAI